LHSCPFLILNLNLFSTPSTFRKFGVDSLSSTTLRADTPEKRALRFQHQPVRAMTDTAIFWSAPE